MLSEFEAIERTYGSEKAGDLRKALHFVLRRQFVFAGDARTGAIYNVIMDGRFRSVIDGFLTVADTVFTVTPKLSGRVSSPWARTFRCRG